MRHRAPIAPSPMGPDIANPAPPTIHPNDTALADDLRRLLDLGLRHKWLIIGLTVTCVICALVWTLMRPPLFVSTISLRVGPEIKILADGNLGGASIETQRDLTTLSKLLESRAMAERVVAQLGLAQDPKFSKGRPMSLVARVRQLLSGPPHSGRDAREGRHNIPLAVDIVLAGRVIQAVRNAKIIRISYFDPDAERTQQIANAYGAAFIAANLEDRLKATDYAKSRLREQIQQTKARVEDSEAQLLAFAKHAGIVERNNGQPIAVSNLATANAKLSELISERVRAQQLWQQMNTGEASDLPQVITNEAVAQLRAERNKLRQTYRDKIEVFKPSYPDMVRLASKIKEVDQQIARETASIRSAMRASYQSALVRENEMKARIVELRRDALDLQERSIRHGILKRDVETNRDIYKNLLQRFKALDAAGTADVGGVSISVLDRARPGAALPIGWKRNLFLALILGLAAGLALAYGLEAFNDRVMSPQMLEGLTQLPTLGVIPQARRGYLAERELAMPATPIAEAYNTLIATIDQIAGTSSPSSIALTSAGPTEGKSLTALALAGGLAGVARRVLLVDADLRHPSLHASLNKSNRFGLTHGLSGRWAAHQLIQPTRNANLAFLAAGPRPANPAQLLAGGAMRMFIATLQERFDVIVVDGPPLLGLADAQLLARDCDTLLLVVAAGRTRKGALTHALKRLALAQCSPAGTVLTMCDPKADRAAYGYDCGNPYGYAPPRAQGNTGRAHDGIDPPGVTVPTPKHIRLPSR